MAKYITVRITCPYNSTGNISGRTFEGSLYYVNYGEKIWGFVTIAERITKEPNADDGIIFN